ncbi:MAG: nucleotidyltransferase family protein [Anaerolineales bacterium]|jgi:CTP:molybdopterin cytidylyltransferase MocA
MSEVLDAVVTAGGIPKPGEPLYLLTQGQPKALLRLVGKPMIQWVLEALEGSSRVGKVVVIGLEKESLPPMPKIASFLPNQGGLLENVLTGMREVLRLNPGSRHALLVSSDIPTITASMVDWTVDTAMRTDDDLYYPIVEDRVMERRFPGSRRTYTHLQEMRVCGGDVCVVRTSTATENVELWRRLIAARKSPMHQASLLGYDLLFLLVLRRLSAARAEAMVSQRLGVKGRVLLSPYAEIGMDVDKPVQYDLVRRDLEAAAT